MCGTDTEPPIGSWRYSVPTGHPGSDATPERDGMAPTEEKAKVEAGRALGGGAEGLAPATHSSTCQIPRPCRGPLLATPMIPRTRLLQIHWPSCCVSPRHLDFPCLSVRASARFRCNASSPEAPRNPLPHPPTWGSRLASATVPATAPSITPHSLLPTTCHDTRLRDF